MMKLLIPVILLLVGVGGGVGAAIMLGPTPDEVSIDGDAVEAANETGDDGSSVDAESEEAEGSLATDEGNVEDETSPVEFLNMTNQFIVPLLEDGVINGLVVVSISLEVIEGTIAAVHQLEPKIRDRFLQVLFNHANNGGFAGNFTDFRYIQSLKDELLRNAQVVAGKDVSDVLILDLVRQDPQ